MLLISLFEASMWQNLSVCVLPFQFRRMGQHFEKIWWVAMCCWIKGEWQAHVSQTSLVLVATNVDNKWLWLLMLSFFVYIVSCVISGRLGTTACLFTFVCAGALLNVCELVFSCFFLFFIPGLLFNGDVECYCDFVVLQVRLSSIMIKYKVSQT